MTLEGRDAAGKAGGIKRIVEYLSPRETRAAALSMSGSSAIVAINALLLKRTKLDGIKQARRQSSQTAAAGARS